MNKVLLATIVALLCFTLTSSVLLADRHSKKEIKNLLNEVETRLDTIKGEGAESYAYKEISKIEQYIKNAKKRLDDNDEDLAFYEISKGKAYFKLIEAKKELMLARTELKNVRTNR